jgi:hypothetical protein
MDTTPRAGKRGRSDSLSSTSSASTSNSQASSSRSLSPVNKILRSTSTPREVIECNLPPTCFPTSQTFETTSELERHQLAFHTFICRTPVRDKPVNGAEAGNPSAVPMEFSSRKRNEWRECRKIFPDQRILDLVSCFFETLSISYKSIILLSNLSLGETTGSRHQIDEDQNVTDIVASNRNARPR